MTRQKRTPRELAAMFELLGHDERAAMEQLLERVCEGRKVYGEAIVASDPRDYVHEALQEALDGCFYLALQCHRLEGSPRLFTPAPLPPPPAEEATRPKSEPGIDEAFEEEVSRPFPVINGSNGKGAA